MTLLYPKIYGPYNRATEGPDKNKIIYGDWTNDEFRCLSEALWFWTEKIDGTNIRILWDGYNRTVGGRTNNAQLNSGLLEFLINSFPEELLEQTFQHKEVVLFGEGFGAGIQNGGKYSPDKSFALFDVAVRDPNHPVGWWWLKEEAVEGISNSLGVSRVPYLGQFTLLEAIAEVNRGLESKYGHFDAEGMVGKPVGGLLSRNGHRIAVKVKTVDFKKV